MIRINLIPHRAEFRQQQIIEHLIVFTSAILLVIALVVVVDVFTTQNLTDLQDEKARLQAQNKELSKKIGELRNLDALRKEVEDKLSIVDELQAGRFRSLITLGELGSLIPQNVWLTDMDDNANQLSMSGFAESSQAVATFLRALQSSELFSNVLLMFDNEATVEGVVIRKFSLTLHRLSLTEQVAQEEAAKGRAGK